MTAVYTITGLIVLTCILICCAFIKQTIIKNNRKKARLFSALEKRSKELLQVLNGFPTGFLPKDLSIFLHRCIVDVFEQLIKLEPERPEFLEQFTLHTTAMENTIHQPVTNHETCLQDPNQINEIRQHLNYLGRFLQKWLQRGNLSEKQYNEYRTSLKRLGARLMVDNYLLSAKKAMNDKKHKLAIHNFTLAKHVITKEGLAGTQKDNLSYITEELTRAVELIEIEEAGITKVEAHLDNNENDEWSDFEDNDEWKKKNIYD